MTDSGNRKLLPLQIKVIAVVRFRAGQVRAGTECGVGGLGDG